MKSSIYMANMSFISILYRYIHIIHPLNRPKSVAKLHAAIFVVAFFTKTTSYTINHFIPKAMELNGSIPCGHMELGGLKPVQ